MLNTNSLITEPETRTFVRFQDCDPLGHLNNARYVDYFLNARQDQLAQHYNLYIYDPSHSTLSSWVVRRGSLAYLKPAAVMEEVLIRTRLIDFTQTALVVEGLMLDKNARNLKSLAWFEFVHISLRNGRPVEHSAELMQLCSRIVVPDGYDPNGFNRRVEVVRHQLRSGGVRFDNAGSAARVNQRPVQSPSGL